MGMTATVDIDQKKYGKLLAKTLPKIIETDEEFDRMAALLEELTIPERELTPEEDALASLIEKLVIAYDDEHYPLPDVPPHRMVLCQHCEPCRRMDSATTSLKAAILDQGEEFQPITVRLSIPHADTVRI